MVAMISSVSSDSRAISVPAASFSSCDMVIGIGQKMPFVIFISSQTPFQSSCPMKPSSGVKPPMPIMIRSPVSRDDTCNWGRDSAFLSSSFFS